MLTVIERARRFIAKCPPAISGHGGHNATFHVASVLVQGFAFSRADALMLLWEWNAGCVPPWSEAELVHKVNSAANVQHCEARGWLLGDGFKPSPIFALPSQGRVTANQGKVDPSGAAEKFLNGFRCDEADAWEASQFRPPDDWRLDAIALLECLYQPGEQINFVTAFVLDKAGKARPSGSGITMARDALVERFGVGMPESPAGGWLRMNPLDGRGVADVNVIAHRFALIECDAVPFDVQLSLFVRLPLPIAAILTSGGKSLHAWVKVDERNADDYRATVARILVLLAKFGVDGKNKNPSRLSRLPGMQRSIGATGDGRQRLLFLNPQAKQGRIL